MASSQIAQVVCTTFNLKTSSSYTMKVDDVLLKERVIASWAVVKGLKGINMRIDTFRVIRADVVKVIFVKI